MKISVIDPISPAIERTKLILFQPFDLENRNFAGDSVFDYRRSRQSLPHAIRRPDHVSATRARDGCLPSQLPSPLVRTDRNPQTFYGCNINMMRFCNTRDLGSGTGRLRVANYLKILPPTSAKTVLAGKLTATTGISVALLIVDLCPMPTAALENLPAMRDSAHADFPCLNISISPERLLRWLMLWIVALSATSFGAQVLIGTLDAQRHRPLILLARKFVVDSEVNLPTYYSSVALLACALLLATISWDRHQNHSRDHWHWTGLSALFLLMSFDEIASLHEMPTATLRRVLDVGGLLYFTWVIPGAVFVSLFIAIYAGFLVRLDRRTRYLFVVAGGTFVAGALGLELVGGSLVERYGFDEIRYYWVATVEEFLEMTGVAIFLFALWEHLGRHQIRFGFSVNQ